MSYPARRVYTLAPVHVVVGAGGMGKSIAQRPGSGKARATRRSRRSLATAAAKLNGDGYTVQTRPWTSPAWHRWHLPRVTSAK